MKNNIIIIGNDHINTLGVIRTFGENNIRPYLILINNNGISSVDKSKYVKKTWFCKDVNTAVLTLITEFSKEKIKPVVVPTSDEAVLYIDKFYDKLNKNFIIPCIKNKKNEISKYMNKYTQFKMANDNNIKMANSIKCSPSELVDIPSKIKYPFIIKPILSAYGNKNDIAICKTEKDLKEIVKEEKYKRYTELIIQEFIEYDYECDIVGFTFKRNTSIPGVIRKTRIWPEKRGSTTYGYIENTNKYECVINDLSTLMEKINYNGIFDVEVFIKGNDYYLNEINFRNSAVSYAYGKSYICYYWYLSSINDKFIESPKIKNEYYFLNDQGDLHNVFDKNISYKQYRRSIKESKILLVKNNIDKKPSKYMCISKILNKMKLMKIISYIKKIYHKDKEEQILFLDGKEFQEKIYNNDYKIVEISKENVLNICQDKEDIREFTELFKNKRCRGLYFLSNDGELIGRGFIKLAGSKDRFIKIKNSNSYLIASIHINEKFRGKKYQCDLVSYLIKYYVKDIKMANIYAVVYKYNIPSKKNLEKIGFKVKKDKTVIRFLKNTINKEIV